MDFISYWYIFTTDSRWIYYIKKPQEVINTIMTHWVVTGYGIMDSILTDNGGEFTAQEIEENASILNVNVLTAAAESPFQNILCERNDTVTDNMLLKLCEDYPNISIDVSLIWTISAKNSLHMWHGCRSYRLVFNQNPNIPNSIAENVPALHGITSNEIFASNFNDYQGSN